jgi:hypothetical protein
VNDAWMMEAFVVLVALVDLLTSLGERRRERRRLVNTARDLRTELALGTARGLPLGPQRLHLPMGLPEGTPHLRRRIEHRLRIRPRVRFRHLGRRRSVPLMRKMCVELGLEQRRRSLYQRRHVCVALGR